MSDFDTDASADAPDIDYDQIVVEALLDVLTLFTTPRVFPVNSCTLGVRVQAETCGPVSEAFQAMQHRIWELDQPDKLTSLNQVLLVPQLMALLRECVANQRWRAAVDALKVLAREPSSNTSMTVWKAGFELLKSDLSGTSGLMLQLFKQLLCLSDIEGKDVLLDYIKYLMVQGRTEEHPQVFETSVPHHWLRGKTVRTGDAELELKAYQGLCYYVEWLKGKHNLSLLQEGEDDDYLTLHSTARSRLAEEELMKVNADKAKAAFSALRESPAVMDVFVSRYTELLEYYEEMEEAEDVLRDYAERQSSNPNSHRYLYHFLRRHRPDDDETLSVLEKFVRMVPSDTLTLELCHTLVQKGAPVGSILRPLFDLLDYPKWGNESAPWRMLHDVVTQIYTSGDKEGMSALGRCWEARATWWPLSHFTPASVDQGKQSNSLLTCKACLAILLTGQSTDFSEAVAKTIHRAESAISEALALVNKFDPP